jgi:hypothetical protein
VPASVPETYQTACNFTQRQQRYSTIFSEQIARFSPVSVARCALKIPWPHGRAGSIPAPAPRFANESVDLASRRSCASGKTSCTLTQLSQMVCGTTASTCRGCTPASVRMRGKELRVRSDGATPPIGLEPGHPSGARANRACREGLSSDALGSNAPTLKSETTKAMGGAHRASAGCVSGPARDSHS